MAITGYAVYGESVGPNFATSLSPTPLSLVGHVLMSVHLVSAFVILINPVSQELEELYKVSAGQLFIFLICFCVVVNYAIYLHKL